MMLNEETEISPSKLKKKNNINNGSRIVIYLLEAFLLKFYWKHFKKYTTELQRSNHYDK